MKRQYFFVIYLITLSLAVHAQISTDGTLGPPALLSGPDYQISSDLGQQMGSNLFHSFQEFNLNQHESATFSGPNTVQNVISRVTGGNPSNIDGLLRSTLPHADMYFLNPDGLIFGPNAQLDVQGAFHASTADYLRLGESGRFDARRPSQSLLTVAPIEAFGFWDNTIAPISLEGPGKITLSEGETQSIGLNVPEGQTLSFIGGTIDMNKGRLIEKVTTNEEGKEVKQTTLLPSLSAPSGQINLIALASKGELKLEPELMEASSFSQFSDLEINNQFLISVSGEGNGQVFIRAKDVLIKNSLIEAKTQGDENGALLDIQVRNLSVTQSRLDARTQGKGTNIQVKIQADDAVEFYKNSNINLNTYDKEEGAGDAGNVLIEASEVSFRQDSGISNSTLGKGNAGEIIIRADKQFSIEKNSSIYLSPFSASTGGNGGKLLIEAENILVAEGSYLSGTTFGPGKGGEITILAKEQVTLSEANSDGFGSGIFSNSNPSKAVAKDGGNIILEAKNLLIEKGAMISSSTISKPGRISGQGGNITLHVDGMIQVDGVNLYGENDEGFGSGIYVRAKGEKTGAAGNIKIEAQALSITNGGVIATTTNNEAQGGEIDIQVKDSVAISGDSMGIFLREPAASQIKFKNNFPDSPSHFSLSGIYGSSMSLSENAGLAGNINLDAHRIFIKGGLISTSTQNAGGGNISLNTSNLLYSQKGQVTTSVKGGSGNGGNIAIFHPTVFVMDKGEIRAQANAGQGGNIHIESSQFITSPDSLISASSKLGIDGQVQIHSPDVNMDGFLVVLPEGFVEKAQLKKCTSEEIENPSSFKIELTPYRPIPFRN
jgi:filamentous hemagglutinin family protein